MPTLERLDVHALREMMTTFRDTVREHAGGLNRLNVYPVPDGDTGTNMSRTLDAVIAEMETADADDLDATCDAISHGSLMGARGNSGVILSQILRGIASTFKQANIKRSASDQAHQFADALTNASSSAYQAVLKPIEGTILTVVRESAEAAKRASGDGSTLLEVVRAARDAGKLALDNTPEQLQVLKDAGVVDAGGAGYLLLLDSALHILGGEPMPDPELGEAIDADGIARAASVAHRAGGAGQLDVSEQRYEVMYFLDLADDRIDEFKQGWGAIGDSIVVVGGDGLWNCHVHTNDIGAAIEVPLDLGGRPNKIRVTDLFEEVAEEHTQREASIGGTATSTLGPGAAMATGITVRAGGGLPPVTTAVVAVCNGDGLVELFANLGVQGIVTGGQSLNPSTAELLDTVEHVNADQVILLPNNKNIIAVAEQVDALTSKQVIVVPTRTMTEALAALVVYDPEASVDENAAEMADASNSVASGEVTQAVRDANSDAGPIVTGDWMGIADGIVAVAGSALDASTQLLDQLIGVDGELLTIITGEDADPVVTASMQAWLADRHGEVQVEVHAGGQPLYPYLFGVE